MRKRVFFISTERYSDFNSMIERYEKEMRKYFSEKHKSGEEEPPAVTTIKAGPSVSEEQQKTVMQDFGEGRIIVEVTTGRGAVPLSDVDVVIDRRDANDTKGRNELIAVETTDKSGRTKPVAVKTVNRGLSLEPGNTEPFSTFYVSASQKGFVPAKKRPVEVFSEEVSILEIDLVPKPEDLYGGVMNG